MKGLRVLDLGTNEGFFAAEAKRQKARRVVGLDQSSGLIEKARARHGDGIEWVAGSWDDSFPAGNFDLVLCLSAFHYAADPEALLAKIRKSLTPSGLFILEAGIAAGDGIEWVESRRDQDTVLFPMKALLWDHLLSDFAVRDYGPSVQPKTDRTERRVFHCRPFKPIVFLIAGERSSGKTVLGRRLAAGGSTVLSADRGLIELFRWEVENVGRRIDGMSALDLEKAGRELCRFFHPSEDLTFSEGYIWTKYPARNGAIERLKKAGFRVWAGDYQLSLRR